MRGLKRRLSPYETNGATNVAARRINEIVHGKRAITALRLAPYFGTSDRFWLNLQARYDLEVERDGLALASSGKYRCWRLERAQSRGAYSRARRRAVCSARWTPCSGEAAACYAETI